MARKFNLQPWRSELRQVQKKRFITITATLALLTAAVCGAYYFFKTGYIADQEEALTLYNNKINEFKKAEAEVKKAKALQEEVVKQISVIQGLQDQRSLTVKILNYLAEKTPTSVFLNNISYKNNIMAIEGVANNEIGVSRFITLLQQFPNFTKVELDGMEQAQPKTGERYSVSDRTGVRTFKLTITVSPSLVDLNKVKEK